MTWYVLVHVSPLTRDLAGGVGLARGSDVQYCPILVQGHATRAEGL